MASVSEFREVSQCVRTESRTDTKNMVDTTRFVRCSESIKIKK